MNIEEAISAPQFTVMQAINWYHKEEELRRLRWENHVLKMAIRVLEGEINEAGNLP